MLVPKLSRITREELQDAPNWVSRLITPINLFFSQTWNCLQNLTVGQNIIGTFANISVETSATYSSGEFPRTFVQWNFKKSVEGVWIAQCRNAEGNIVVNTTPITVDWVQTPNGIQILYVTGLTDSTKYNIRVLAL